MIERLDNGMTLRHGAFPLGTDTMLLAQFAALPARARVADLGAGCGTLGVLLCKNAPDCAVTGVELDAAAHVLALENIRENGLEGRLTALHGDVRQIRALLPAAEFDCVVSNPPYFPVGSGRPAARVPAARDERTLPLEALCAAAAWLLRQGGRFFLVHRAERLCDLLCTLRASGLEPKRLRLVRGTSGKTRLVLLEARRGGRPGLTVEPDQLV